MLKDLVAIPGVEAVDWHIDQSVILDSLVYEEEDFQGVIDTCKDWYKTNPDIYTFLVDRTDNEERLAAYVNAMPITEDLFYQILEGKVIDTLISKDDILTYEDNNEYYLYFCSIVVHPDYQNTRAFTVIFDAFMQSLIKLSERNIYIKAVTAEGATKKGARLCRLSGLRKHLDTDRGTEIYYSEELGKDFRPTSCSSKQVKDIYEE